MAVTRDTRIMKPRIHSEQLESIFRKWVGPTTNNTRWVDHIDRVNLNWGVGKQFDLYVWENGGRIGKEYGKRYAEFFDDHNLTMFILRWS